VRKSLSEKKAPAPQEQPDQTPVEVK